MVILIGLIAAIVAQAAHDAASDLKSKVVNFVSSPVVIDSCRAFTKIMPGGYPVSMAYMSLHNSGKKTIEVIGVTLIPFTVFNDSAGQPVTSILNVNLAPGDVMPEDYKFTDGAKQPVVGGIGFALESSWHSPYVINCIVSKVRFSDGTIYSAFPGSQ